MGPDSVTGVSVSLPDPVLRPELPDLPKAPRSFHLLTKPTGAICNLDCSYCFFLSKEELYPDSPFRMNDVLLEEYVRQLLESHRDDEVTVAWQGGEPTMMRLPFFARSVELVQKHKRPGQRVEYTIQTNGTLLDDEWGAFLKEHDFLVGISIDGPREIHDTYRVDKGGKPTFDRVMVGLDVLKRHEVRWNALTTVHHANEDHGLAVYTFLRDELGAEFVQFIPIVERESAGPIPVGDQVTDRSVSPGGYGRFLIEVFEEWVRRDVGRVYVQMFDTSLANWVGVPGALCVHSETCGTALALEHNGDVYSCDHFVEPDYLLGNIATSAPARPGRLPATGRVRSGQAGQPAQGSAAAATCGSPVTVGAPRTGSPPPPMASPACTTCARATWSSSGTSTGPCATWPPGSGSVASPTK